MVMVHPIDDTCSQYPKDKEPDITSFRKENTTNSVNEVHCLTIINSVLRSQISTYFEIVNHEDPSIC